MGRRPGPADVTRLTDTVAWRSQGRTYRWIAAQRGVSVQAIQRYCARHCPSLCGRRSRA